MIIGVPLLASPWREGDFAVALFVASISLIMVNLIFASENRVTDKAELKSDNNLNDSGKSYYSTLQQAECGAIYLYAKLMDSQSSRVCQQDDGGCKALRLSESE